MNTEANNEVRDAIRMNIIRAKVNEIRKTSNYKRVREEFEIVERLARKGDRVSIDSAMMNVATLLEDVLFDTLKPFYELLDASRAELVRATLTSNPRKFEFAEANGIEGKDGFDVLDKVHAHMSKTRVRFEEAVEKLKGEIV